MTDKNRTPFVTAPVFEVQRFSVHDGPGIRTLVFLKGCLMSCKWCQNPESQERSPVIAFYKNRCQENFHCQEVCPENAIQSDDFRINYDQCNLCEKCLVTCSHDALKLIGERMTAEELTEHILRDLTFYQTSGGGVTFSGGEPTLYPDFLSSVLDLCRENQVHTTIETSGTFSYRIWESILRKLDLIYFDLKIADDLDHKEATGLSNLGILENAIKLVDNGFPVEFRMPLVQGFTDSRQNIRDTINFLQRLKQDRIHLLRYHNMGEAKIDIIQGKQEKLEIPTYPLEKFNEIQSLFKKRGILVVNEEMP